MIVLEDVHTPYGNIKIMESQKEGIITYYQGDCFQSQIDSNGTSTCAYIHVMKDVMLAAKPKRALVIGSAGGTLATLLHRAGCAVTMLDINAYAFTLARRYFQLPDAVECIEADGFDFLQSTDIPFQAIAVDAFNAKGIIPLQMRKKDFFRFAREAVGEQGVVVMNVMTAHDLDMDADRIAQKMAEASLPVVLYDWPGVQNRNTLIAGGNIPQLTFPNGTEPPEVQKEFKGITCRRAML